MRRAAAAQDCAAHARGTALIQPYRIKEERGMLRLIAVLIVGTVAMFGITTLVAQRYDPEVRARFLEHRPSYTRDSLAAWVRAHEADAAGYVVPVLFPLDLLFMAFLAALLAVLS